jgi:septin family protein
LYEIYRTEKLSKIMEVADGAYVILCFLLDTVFIRKLALLTDVIHRNLSISEEDLASQSIRLKEEQFRKEEENFRKIEMKIQQEFKKKSQELLVREAQLPNIGTRINQEAAGAVDQQDAAANSQIQASRDRDGK